jgi:N-acetylglucosamine-6-phosphate deacetylase
MRGEIAEMADFYLKNGTTTWYPTTMTMSYEDIIAATKVTRELGHGASIPGFHLEGPFINEKYKGAQNAQFIKNPTMELIERCEAVKLVTIAPELDGAIDFIRECPAVVALGHTDCDYDTARAAFEAGARSLTHTFNAMPPIHHRAPGPIIAGMDDGRVYAQLIADGIHVHPASVRALIKLYGIDNVVLISDSVEAAGLEDGNYTLGGQDIIVKDRTARTLGGNLAGSTSTLFDCVKCAISFGIPKKDAVKMASETPALMMGLNKGKIEVGYDADLIIVDSEFNLIRAIARGEV